MLNDLKENNMSMGTVKLLKQKIRAISQIRKFIVLEFKSKHSLGLLKFIRTSRFGFFSFSSLLYDFSINKKEYYVSDLTRIMRTSRINGSRKIVLDDKLIFHAMNKNNPHVIPILAFTKHGKLYKITGNTSHEIFSKDDFKSFVAQFLNGLIIKPYTGGGGSQISKVIYENEKLRFYGDCDTFEQFKDNVINNKREFLMTEIIKQDNVLSEIYPKTLNTVRILTMLNPDSNTAFIASAVLRIGTEKSNVVDNWTAGGLSISINLKTGELGKGATYPNKKGEKIVWHETHPDSHVKFYGVQIPNWQEITKSILEFSQEYHFLPYVGWDVVPMNNDFIILEGNTTSDVNLLQIHGGLLRENKIKSFYKYYNVI